MRIALVHYSYPPVVGGVENIVAAHARLFAEAGHEVTVICKRGESADPRIRLALLGGGEMLQPLLAEQEVVFLHNVCTMPFDLALTEALWFAGTELKQVRFVCWVHDLAACNPDYARPPDGRWDLLGRAHDRFEYVAISEYRARQWEQLSGAVAIVIPNGVDPCQVLGLSELGATLLRNYDLLSRDIVLLHPARLLRRKRVEVSLRVVAAMKEAGERATLIVTGPADPHHAPSSEYAAEIRALRETLGIEREALFLYPDFMVGENDMAALYQLADALLFPSAEEGFGLPLLEAALHRIEIFCPDLPPLNTLSLPGRNLFASDIAPRELARLIANAVHASPMALARKAVARDSAWRTIYRKFLAPLLSESNIDRCP